MGFDDFDEERYLKANPDVAVMVGRGLFRSPLDHWQRSGSLEHAAGRRRAGFYEHDQLYDEETYLRQNPDVLALLRRRVIGSGYEHWMRHGRVEFSRGRRHAPFVAGAQPFRPFRLSLGDAGVLLVGPLERAPSQAALTLRYGDDPATPVPPSAIGWAEQLRVVDARHREQRLGLAMVRAPLPGAESRRPRPLALSDGGPEPLVLSRDAGMQGFFFADGPDANRFLEGALGLEWPGSGAHVEALTAFVVGRLQRTADPREPFSGFFLESLTPRDGAGFDASGWFAPAGDAIRRISVWCPESGECADAESLTRVERPDVVAQLGDALGTTPDPRLGFCAFLPLPVASRRAPARLVFGVALGDTVLRFFESRDSRLITG